MTGTTYASDGARFKTIVFYSVLSPQKESAIHYSKLSCARDWYHLWVRWGALQNHCVLQCCSSLRESAALIQTGPRFKTALFYNGLSSLQSGSAVRRLLPLSQDSSWRASKSCWHACSIQYQIQQHARLSDSAERNHCGFSFQGRRQGPLQPVPAWGVVQTSLSPSWDLVAVRRLRQVSNMGRAHATRSEPK